MEKKDRDEMRELMQDILATHTAITDGKFNHIANELSAIKEKTTKTNGRINKMEQETIPAINERFQKIAFDKINHVLECPQAKRVKSLEDEQLSRKTLRNFFVVTIASAAGIVTIILGLFKLFSGTTWIISKV